jgi:hypothetical protein
MVHSLIAPFGLPPNDYFLTVFFLLALSRSVSKIVHPYWLTGLFHNSFLSIYDRIYLVSQSFDYVLMTVIPEMGRVH